MEKKGGKIVPFKGRRRGLKVSRFLILLGFIILLLGPLLYYVPIFTLQRIEIEGNVRLTADDIVRLTALEPAAIFSGSSCGSSGSGSWHLPG